LKEILKATRFLHRFLPKETDMGRRYWPKDNFDKNYGHMHPPFGLEVSIFLSMLKNLNICRTVRIFSDQILAHRILAHDRLLFAPLK